MIDELTVRMWVIFDETGVFLTLCRHGFVLLIVDMIQSGKLCISTSIVSYAPFLMCYSKC